MDEDREAGESSEVRERERERVREKGNRRGRGGSPGLTTREGCGRLDFIRVEWGPRYGLVLLRTFFGNPTS